MAPLDLTEAMLDRVIYGMENQRDILVIDPDTGDVRPGEETENPGIPLPEWSPADGYQLMNRFASTLVNPVFRERLQVVLRSGHGVFRRFKNELKERPELERLWRRFKKAEMRKKALSWLAGYAEKIRLEGLGEPPEDIDDLPLTDFAIRPARDGDLPRVWEFDRAALIEEWPALSPEERRSVIDHKRRGREPGSGRESLLVAVDPSDEIVGFVWSTMEDDGKTPHSTLHQIYVLPAYRGLGLGAILLRTLLARRDDGHSPMTAEVPEGREFLGSVLKENGFGPVSTLWRLPGRDQP